MVQSNSPADTPSIALIHGVSASIAPANESLERTFPRARLWNILDDRLIDDTTALGSVTPALRQRMQRLIDHALAQDVAAIVLTCSLYSFMADEQTGRTPVLGSDDAAFAEALEARARIVLVSSVPLALRDSESRLHGYAAARQRVVDVIPLFVDGALAAVRRSEAETLVGLLAGSVRPHLRPGDVVMLAQYSLAPAAELLAWELGTTVISPPAASARALSRVLAD